MIQDKFDVKENINNMLDDYKISKKLKLSIEYYFEAKINMCNKKNINIENINIWISNFKKNICSIKEKKELKYTWVNLNNDKKELIIGMGREVNIDEKVEYNSSVNIKTSQYVYELFCVLEAATNIEYSN
ncbi:MAG: hypothetical protein RSC92_04340, partial [Clostridia bacterium]